LHWLPPRPIHAEDGIAIRGINPVAYFTDGASVSGDPVITADVNGATWRFTTTANHDASPAAPDAYARQYGGYCASAVAAKGRLYVTGPENRRMMDGKQYLDCRTQVQADRNRDIPGFIAEGNRHRPEIMARVQ
jgi:hypothetical protein